MQSQVVVTSYLDKTIMPFHVLMYFKTNCEAGDFISWRNDFKQFEMKGQLSEKNHYFDHIIVMLKIYHFVNSNFGSVCVLFPTLFELLSLPDQIFPTRTSHYSVFLLRMLTMVATLKKWKQLKSQEIHKNITKPVKVVFFKNMVICL